MADFRLKLQIWPENGIFRTEHGIFQIENDMIQIK